MKYISLLYNFSLHHYEDLGWQDFAHIESPAHGYRMLINAELDISRIELSRTLQLRRTGSQFSGLSTDRHALEENVRLWLLDEVRRGHAFLRVEKPAAPVVCWQPDTMNPLGGTWQWLPRHLHGTSEASEFWLRWRINYITHLKSCVKKPERVVAEVTTKPIRQEKKEELIKSAPFSFS